ncbi:MAG: nucleoside phosphorylase [Desulfobacterales bacterium]|nr:nucleoside phosphorylase [Desulfobacterales bacterium]
MDGHEPIVNPSRRKGFPVIGPVAVMAGSQSDIHILRTLFQGVEENDFNLYLGKLHVCHTRSGSWSIAGPLVGAPYAVMILENLIAMGARKIIFFGWCGAVSPAVRIGDIIVPTAAVVDEGTSRHYQPEQTQETFPSENLLGKLKAGLIKKKFAFHEGVVWTTDAIFRETREKVAYFQARDVLAVEMELSALFTVGRFRHVEVGAVLVVSDELSTFQWHPGFGDERFKQGRKNVSEVVNSLCTIL